MQTKSEALSRTRCRSKSWKSDRDRRASSMVANEGALGRFQYILAVFLAIKSSYGAMVA